MATRSGPRRLRFVDVVRSLDPRIRQRLCRGLHAPYSVAFRVAAGKRNTVFPDCRASRIGRVFLLTFLALPATLPGCNGKRSPSVSYPDPVPQTEAIGRVNGNLARIAGTLRASGSADGYFTLTDGRRVHFSLDGVMFYLAPMYFRFDLKKFGDRQLLIGSNEREYWFYSKEEDRFHCREHGDGGAMAGELPVRSDQIVEALGLTPIPEHDPDAATTTCIQRITEAFQEILFLSFDEDGRLQLRKEYWLDRGPPRLVRRVIFRDEVGAIEMQSELDDYRAVESDGPLLPHVMEATWPAAGGKMRFRVGSWSTVPQVGPVSPQFAAPPECRSGP